MKTKLETRPNTIAYWKQIAEETQLRATDYRHQIDRAEKEIKQNQERMKLIAAENESLRMDKKWLQQQLSGIIQTTLANTLKDN